MEEGVGGLQLRFHRARSMAGNYSNYPIRRPPVPRPGHRSQRLWTSSVNESNNNDRVNNPTNLSGLERL